MRAIGNRPVILVAALVLCAALAGTAVAGPEATTSAKKLSKKEKKQVKKLAKKQIGKAESGLDVNSAKTADSATTAADASKLSGQELLYAKVTAGGVLTKTKGVTTVVKQAGMGHYQVNFDRNVTACVMNATDSAPGGSSGGFPNIDESASGSPTNSRDVFIFHHTGGLVDAAFDLVAYC